MNRELSPGGGEYRPSEWHILWDMVSWSWDVSSLPWDFQSTVRDRPRKSWDLSAGSGKSRTSLGVRSGETGQLLHASDHGGTTTLRQEHPGSHVRELVARPLPGSGGSILAPEVAPAHQPHVRSGRESEIELLKVLTDFRATRAMGRAMPTVTLILKSEYMPQNRPLGPFDTALKATT